MRAGLMRGDEGAEELKDLGFSGHGVVHVPTLGVGAFRRGAVVLRQQAHPPARSAWSRILCSCFSFFLKRPMGYRGLMV